MGSVGAFKIPRLDTADSTARRHDGARAPRSGVRPRIEATTTGGVSPLHRTPAEVGVHCTSDGGLVITHRVKSLPRGRPVEITRTGVALSVVVPRPLAPPPGLPTRPPPRFVSANQMEVVTQVVLGHVQAVFEQLQESLERRLLQGETGVPRERSRPPLHEPSPGETRFTEISSQEDSGPDLMVKVSIGGLCTVPRGGAGRSPHRARRAR